MEELFTLNGLAAVATLASLEIVLGIDNIIFIAIVASRLPEAQRERARVIGLSLAIFTRIGLLSVLAWFMKLTKPLLIVAGQSFSGKDMILILGGLFLLAKSTHEIHAKFEEASAPQSSAKAGAKFATIIAQILMLDIIFSIDSVITAVGMVNNLPIMILAILISVAVMLAFSAHVVRFIDRNPTIKMLALSFLLMIGVLLVAEGFGKHIDKGYIYFSMAFSLGVEMLNIKLRARRAAEEIVATEQA